MAFSPCFISVIKYTDSFFLKVSKLGMMADAFNPSTQQIEAVGSL